jgi:outer membrane protein TolC
MRKIFKIVSFATVLLAGLKTLSGQQSPDSLMKYLEIAARNNPTVIQKFTEYKASLQKIPQVGSLPDPQLDLGVFIKPMELVSGNQVADLRLMQMFPWFGVLKNAKDEMSLMAKAKFELFRDSKLEVYYDVQRTWYELFRLRKDISISERNLDILGVIEQLSLIKYKAPALGNSGSVSQQSGTSAQGNINVSSYGGSGMQEMGGSKNNQGNKSPVTGSVAMQSGSMASSPDGSGLTDLYRIKIESGELKNNIALLKNQEQTTIARFNNYLNRPPLTKVFTGEVLLPDSLTLNLSIVPDSIRSNNPMLNMLNYEKEAYLARKKMVTGMGYPMVGLGLNYTVIGRNEMSTSSMNGKDMIMPMVSVTLPIYRKKYTAMREEADLLSKASSENFQAVSNSLNTDYFSAVQLYRDAQRRVKLYEGQYTLASKSLEIMLKSFSASAASLTDVLRVRQQTLDYEIKQVEAITDLNTSIAWLNRLMATSKNQ